MTDQNKNQIAPLVTDGFLLLVNGPDATARPIEELFLLLETHVLDPLYEAQHAWRFRPYRNLLLDVRYIEFLDCPSIEGNFLGVNHPFHLVVKDRNLLNKLGAAFALNVAKPAYQELAYPLYRDWSYVYANGAVQIAPECVAQAIRTKRWGKCPPRYQSLRGATILEPRYSSYFCGSVAV